MIHKSHSEAFRSFIVLTLFALSATLAFTQTACEFASPEAAEKLEKSLEKAKSCKRAAALFNECRWGSSADVGFAGIVIAKCKQEYRGKLTPAQQRILTEKIDLCTYEYSRQGGTLAISETVSCHVDVAVAFAADPQKAAVPLPSASFDCRLARTLLEHAICSDALLGRADLVLSRVYSGDLKFAKGADRTSLVNSEKKWLDNLPSKCGLITSPPSSTTLACLRDEFELRFTLLDECGDDMEACLNSNQPG